MNIVVISGSMRADAQSLKVASFVSQKLNAMEDITSSVFDLHTNPLSIDINEVWAKPEATAKMTELLEAADGFVVVTPEWNGMASAGLTNMFHHVGKTMAHKPAVIASVSAARGGAMPVAELRMASYKNSRLNYIPDHLIIRQVTDVLNTPEPNTENNSDVFYHKQIDYTLSLLVEYAKALQAVRNSGVIDHDAFENGMS